MEKRIVYEKKVSRGHVFYVALNELYFLLPERDTQKAWAVGEVHFKTGRPEFAVRGWIPKSLSIAIDNKPFVPTWILDKMGFDLTKSILRNYDKEFEVVKL